VLDGFDHSLAVVIHAPQLDAVAMLVGIKKPIGRLQPNVTGLLMLPGLMTWILPT
jgi:hypothetical protein